MGCGAYDLGVDYRRCPIPKTHRRLVEAQALWHQSLDLYQKPELFHANLKATIQALRKVTFVLQSEKRMFGEFDDWDRHGKNEGIFHGRYNN